MVHGDIISFEYSFVLKIRNSYVISGIYAVHFRLGGWVLVCAQQDTTMVTRCKLITLYQKPLRSFFTTKVSPTNACSVKIQELFTTLLLILFGLFSPTFFIN